MLSVYGKNAALLRKVCVQFVQRFEVQARREQTGAHTAYLPFYLPFFVSGSGGAGHRLKQIM